ncbi:MAG: M48 family metallopeptidase [Clostridia bacterium]|nr:M48 family metallopeptidase [Clostridia bacterium]
MIPYSIVFSKRKTLSLQVKADGTVTVRAPAGTKQKIIEDFVDKNSAWLEKTKKKMLSKQELFREASSEEEKELRKKAKAVLPEKISRYSSLIGVMPTRITITGARTRFGSCSGKNSISFSFYLMRFPEEAIDYVVVHELCHIKHHDHSKEFYKEIEKILPDYKQREKLLRH